MGATQGPAYIFIFAETWIHLGTPFSTLLFIRTYPLRYHSDMSESPTLQEQATLGTQNKHASEFSQVSSRCCFCLTVCFDYQCGPVLARCAVRDHDVEKSFGELGKLAFVLLFPVGLICLLYVYPSLSCILAYVLT